MNDGANPVGAGHEAIERDKHLVHKWRVAQLERLGIPEPLAEAAGRHYKPHATEAVKPESDTFSQV